eukprot:TRINITY_DN9830_c0_g1_i1.p1 TRINITY_DN9830_c0_g1~~TRINITY_DN9830_c0_g1_i1.p1  ORF type:complete len:424 (+),score=74.45 TRINITY_DN9830_c0_g1_i1:294-1565(+)
MKAREQLKDWQGLIDAYNLPTIGTKRYWHNTDVALRTYSRMRKFSQADELKQELDRHQYTCSVPTQSALLQQYYSQQRLPECLPILKHLFTTKFVISTQILRGLLRCIDVASINSPAPEHPDLAMWIIRHYRDMIAPVTEMQILLHIWRTANRPLLDLEEIMHKNQQRVCILSGLEEKYIVRWRAFLKSGSFGVLWRQFKEHREQKFTVDTSRKMYSIMLQIPRIRIAIEAWHMAKEDGHTVNLEILTPYVVTLGRKFIYDEIVPAWEEFISANGFSSIIQTDSDVVPLLRNVITAYLAKGDLPKAHDILARLEYSKSKQYIVKNGMRAYAFLAKEPYDASPWEDQEIFYDPVYDFGVLTRLSLDGDLERFMDYLEMLGRRVDSLQFRDIFTVMRKLNPDISEEQSKEWWTKFQKEAANKPGP